MGDRELLLDSARVISKWQHSISGLQPRINKCQCLAHNRLRSTSTSTIFHPRLVLTVNRRQGQFIPTVACAKDGDLLEEGIDSSGGGGGSSDNWVASAEGSYSSRKKVMDLAMSQKFTLGYAALVGLGGLMGFWKSGSHKSLLAGGISSSILYYVHTQLPANPVFASSIGLVVSSALTGVMGARFARTGKIFPAGIVSLLSLVMAGGYAHGILRTAR